VPPRRSCSPHRCTVSRAALELKDEKKAKQEHAQIARYLELCDARRDAVLGYVRSDAATDLGPAELEHPRYLAPAGAPNFTWKDHVLPLMESRHPEAVRALARWLDRCSSDRTLADGIVALERHRDPFHEDGDLAALPGFVSAVADFDLVRGPIAQVWSLAFERACPPALRAHINHGRAKVSDGKVKWDLAGSCPARLALVGAGREATDAWIAGLPTKRITDRPVAWVGFAVKPETLTRTRLADRGTLLLAEPSSTIKHRGETFAFVGVFWRLKRHHPKAGEVFGLSEKIAAALDQLGASANLGWLRREP
jgi:hypothetical protein